MNNLILVVASVVACLALGSSGQTSTEPSYVVDHTLCLDKDDGTMIVDAHDQHVYYECLNKLAFKFHCAAALVFNPSTRQCQWDPNGPTVRPPYTGTSKFDCHGKQDGFYPDEQTKAKFHECVSGYPYDFDCPPGTYFDQSKSACAYDYSALSTVSQGTSVPVDFTTARWSEPSTTAVTPVTDSAPTDSTSTGSPAEVTTAASTASHSDQTTRGRHDFTIPE